MLAIHNLSSSGYFSNKVANAFAKLSKCQQFTTKKPAIDNFIELQTLLQSYQNVSNSQLKLDEASSSYCCKRFCKVIKMLAIHNIIMQSFNLFLLQTLLQSYQNVSNSQLLCNCINQLSGCKRFCKVIKMLAIHNSFLHIPY